MATAALYKYIFWDTLYTSFAKKLMNDYHTTKVTLFIRPHTTQQSQKFKYRKKDLIEKYLNCEVCPHLLVKIGRVEHPVQSPLVAKLTLEDHLKQNWFAISHSSV